MMNGHVATTFRVFENREPTRVPSLLVFILQVLDVIIYICIVTVFHIVEYKSRLLPNNMTVWRLGFGFLRVSFPKERELTPKNSFCEFCDRLIVWIYVITDFLTGYY